MQNLKQDITISQNETTLTLPLENFMRLFMVHMQSLLPDYYEKKQSNNIKDFFTYLEEELDLIDEDGKKKTILL